MAAFAAFPPLKMVTVVDDDVDIRKAADVEWAMTNRLDPLDGVITIPACFGHGQRGPLVFGNTEGQVNDTLQGGLDDSF